MPRAPPSPTLPKKQDEVIEANVSTGRKFKEETNRLAAYKKSKKIGVFFLFPFRDVE
jgi:hypothetical protein